MSVASVAAAVGAVVATDLQIKFLQAIDAPNLEVRKHDIAQDGLEENAFDKIRRDIRAGYEQHQTDRGHQ